MKRRALAALALALAPAAGCVTARAGPAHGRRVPLGPVQLARIAVWRNDARAAYSIVHDDMCDDSVEGIYGLALPALRRRQLHVGVAAIAQTCEVAHRWREVEEASAQGHEIVSHSYSHARLTAENAAVEIASVKPTFERHARRPVEFFVFPYDEFTPGTLAAVEKAGYRGARGGNRDQTDALEHPPINTAEPGHDFTVMFDVWPRPYSRYPLYDGVALLNVQVWDAIEHRGWAMRELHGVVRDEDPPDPNAFGPVSLSTYEAHLDFLVQARRANLVWTDTPSAVLRYRHARTACRAAVDGERIVFDASAPECVRYSTPLSVIVTTRADLPGLRATQRGKVVPVLGLGPGEFSVTADPTAGDVRLSGSETPSPAVDTAAVVPGRPRPASSICELATEPALGKVDNFERPGPQPEVVANDLPNWSPYPKSASMVRVMEGDNALGRFTGRALGAWSGATFLFAGRENVGCFDATPYTGVRFRMRGRVEAPDEMAGLVIVSVISAETRPRIYGGELLGTGSHFHATLTVTPEWKTFELPFGTLDPPSWGDTASLTALAVKKLQALDWGVANTVTQFEIDLDDVELY
jgi:peptidoglycan/xylan/chitin deacetylase (PgdA/CDA1 family)